MSGDATPLVRTVRDDIAALAQMAAGHASNLMVHKTRAQKLRQERKAAMTSADSYVHSTHAGKAAAALCVSPSVLCAHVQQPLYVPAGHVCMFYIM